VDIDLDNYERDHTAVPYFRYYDNGTEYTVYAEYEKKYNLSVIDTANGMIENGLDTDGSVAKVIEEYNSYKNK
jgi:hypothetical protein